MFGIFAQCTDGSLDVLCLQDVLNVLRHQVIMRHAPRIEPDTHGKGIAKYIHFTNTLDALQARLDVDIKIVGDEITLEAVVRTFQGDDFQEGLL